MGLLDTHDAFVDARRNWSKYNLGIDFDTAWHNYYDKHYDPENLQNWADPVWSEEAWNNMVRENGGDPDLYKDDYNDLDTFGESVMESFDIMTATDIVRALYDKYPEIEFVYEDDPKDGEVLLVFDLGDSPLDMEELTSWLEGCGADVSFAGPYMKLLVPEDEMDESLRTKLFKKIGCYSDGSPMEESLLESSNNFIDDSDLADIEDEIYFDLGLEVEVDNDDSYEYSDKAIKITLEDSSEPYDDLLDEIFQWFKRKIGKTILKGYTWTEAAYDSDSISIGIKTVADESLSESTASNAKKSLSKLISWLRKQGDESTRSLNRGQVADMKNEINQFSETIPSAYADVTDLSNQLIDKIEYGVSCNKVANVLVKLYAINESLSEEFDPNKDYKITFQTTQYGDLQTHIVPGKDVEEVLKKMKEHKYIVWPVKECDTNESLNEDEIKRYSDVVPKEKRKYWYFTTHGVQPGSVPKGVGILEVRDGVSKNGMSGTFVCLDAILNTSELKEYDMKEERPVDEAKEKKPYDLKGHIEHRGHKVPGKSNLILKNKSEDESLTEGAMTNGSYSLYNGWVKVPDKDSIPDQYPELEPEYTEWVEKANKCETIDDIDAFLDDVYKLRQQGLLSSGEYGKENLIFKELRNNGFLQELKDMKVKLQNKEMSLEGLQESVCNESASLSYEEAADFFAKKGLELRQDIFNLILSSNGIKNDMEGSGELNWNEGHKSEGKEQLNEAELDDSRAQELANYLDIDASEVEKGNYDNSYIVGDEEYYVLTYDEAEALAKEQVKEMADEMGLEAFSKDFQEDILYNYIDDSAIDEFIDEEADYFRTQENDEVEAERLEALSPTDRLEYIYDIYGPDGFEDWAKDYINWDLVAEEVVRLDGPENGLATYDGNEIQLDTYYAYRID